MNVAGLVVISAIVGAGIMAVIVWVNWVCPYC
jgi:hypothetical protein